MEILTTREIVENYGNNQLLVPDFQRDYVWREQEWSQLWEDLVFTANAAEAGNKNAQHFMGIVTLKPCGNGKLELLDGQQRLTTVAALLDYCQMLLPETISILFSSRSVRRGGKITVNDLRKLNKEREEKKAGDENDLARLRLYARLFNCFDERFRLSRVSVQDFAETLLNRFFWCVDEREAGENSNRIFESLNATGLPLRWTDLILSELMNGTREEPGGFRQRWENLLQAIYEGELLSACVSEEDSLPEEEQEGETEGEMETPPEQRRDMEEKPLKFKKFLNCLNNLTLPASQSYHENIPSFNLILKRLRAYMASVVGERQADDLELLEQWSVYYLILVNPTMKNTSFAFSDAAERAEKLIYCDEESFGIELYYYSLIRDNQTLPMLMRVLWKFQRKKYGAELVRSILGAVNRYLLLKNVCVARNTSEEWKADRRSRFLDELVDEYIREKGQEPDMKAVFSLLYPSAGFPDDVLRYRIEHHEYDSRFSKLLLCLEHDGQERDKPVWRLESTGGILSVGDRFMLPGPFEVEHMSPRSRRGLSPERDAAELDTLNLPDNLILLERALNRSAQDRSPEEKEKLYRHSALAGFYRERLGDGNRIGVLCDLALAYLREALGEDKNGENPVNGGLPLETPVSLWRLERRNGLIVKTERFPRGKEGRPENAVPTEDAPLLQLSEHGFIRLLPETPKDGELELTEIFSEEDGTASAPEDERSKIMVLFSVFFRRCRERGLWDELIKCLVGNPSRQISLYPDRDCVTKNYINARGQEVNSQYIVTAKDGPSPFNPYSSRRFRNDDILFSIRLNCSDVISKLAELYAMMEKSDAQRFFLWVKVTRAEFQVIRGKVRKSPYRNIGERAAYEGYVFQKLTPPAQVGAAPGTGRKTEVTPYLTADTKSLRQLLDTELSVPEYQRKYVWRTPQYQALSRSLESGVTSLGTLILRETEKGYSVVDGRQRLTTLLLASKHYDHLLLREVDGRRIEEGKKYFAGRTLPQPEKLVFPVLVIRECAPEPFQYNVFSSVNGKGKKLSFAEIIKNFLHSRLSGSVSPESIRRVSGDGRFIKAFLERHYCRHISEADMYKDFIGWYDEAEDGKGGAFRELSAAYSVFREKVAGNGSGSVPLTLYNRLGVTTGDALLLRVFQDLPGEENRALRERFLERLMLLYFLLYVMDGNGNANKSINGKLPRLAKLSGEELARGFRLVWQGDKGKKQETIDLLNGILKPEEPGAAEKVWKALCREEIGQNTARVGQFLLLVLEWALGTDLGGLELERLEIEHIWPASRGSAELNVNKLENLCLLEDRINLKVRDHMLLEEEEGKEGTKTWRAYSKLLFPAKQGDRFIPKKGAKQHIYAESELRLPRMFYQYGEDGKVVDFNHKYVDLDTGTYGAAQAKKRMGEVKDRLLREGSPFVRVLLELLGQAGEETGQPQ